MAKPELRIKGFEDEWFMNLIGNISSTYSGGTPSAGNPNYYGGTIPFIRSGEIHEDKTELFLTEEGLSASSAKIVEKGTLLYAMYGATSGETDISKIHGAINQAILAIQPQNGFDNYFLSYLLQGKKDNIVGTLLQGGQGNLSGALIKNYLIYFPCFIEQQHIANYFKSLDSMIQAATKKIASLKQMKQACLVSMFPQAGETTPRIRFKGFEGEWMYVELSECLTVCKDRNISESYNKIDVLSVSDDYGVVNQIEFLGRSYAGKSVANYRILKHGDIVYTKSPLKAKPFGIIKVNNGNNGIVSTLYAVFTPMDWVSAQYISCYFEPAFRMNKYIHPLVNKGAKNDMKVSDENVLKGKIYIPKDIAEQQKIASFFRSLDTQISLQEQRLDKLKQIKSACLDKMFV